MKKLFAIILSLGLIIAPVGSAGRAHASGGGAVQQLFGIANGIIGSDILIKCKLGAMQPSIMAYMAGSLVYILGELTTAKDKKNSLNTQATDLAALKTAQAGQGGGDLQKNIIDQQIQSEEKNLEVIQKRSKFIMATLVVYAVATILAMLEQWGKLVKPDIGACTTRPEMNIWKAGLISSAYTMLSSGELNAMGLVTGVAASVGMKLLLAKLIKVSNEGEKLIVPPLNTATGRIIIFGVLSGVVGLIVAELKKSKQAAKQRIADLRKVRDSFIKDENGMEQGSSGSTQQNSLAENKSAQLNQGKLVGLSNGAVADRSCFSSDQKSFSPEACKSPYRIPRPNIMGSGIGMPLVNEGVSTSSDLVDSLSSGDSARAEVQAGKLASMAGRITKIKDELVNKMNKELMAQGKKPINFDEESKKLMTQFNSELMKNGFSNGNLASSGSGEAALSEVVKGASDTSQVSAVVAPAVTPNVDPGLDLKGIDQDLTESTDLELDSPKTSSLSDSLNEFESSEADIAKTPEVSIFKQLSNRYILNYTKIFSRKEVVPESAPTEAPKD
jgi:hypothetical protein